MQIALQTVQLAKRYGRNWGLRDCSFSMPEGKITAFVGPNGAGKTTLLHLAVGLLQPNSGEVMVFGRSPTANTKEVLQHIGFVAQDHPLYRNFTVSEMMRAARLLNKRWDEQFARMRLDQLDIAQSKQVGKLSGGQQAQVALVLALAKRPELLLLDEPLASLDPLARRDFLNLLLTTTQERGASVLLSSHIIGDLESICNHLIILANGSVRLVGDIVTILAEHRVVRQATLDTNATKYTIIEQTSANQVPRSLIKLNEPVYTEPTIAGVIQSPSLEDVAIAYLRQAQASDQ